MTNSLGACYASAKRLLSPLVDRTCQLCDPDPGLLYQLNNQTSSPISISESTGEASERSDTCINEGTSGTRIYVDLDVSLSLNPC